jgi:hypothetical protein
MEKLSNAIEMFLFNMIPSFFVGETISGVPMSQVSRGFNTTHPPVQLSEFEWMREFRVGSLHKVEQRVFLG